LAGPGVRVLRLLVRARYRRLLVHRLRDQGALLRGDRRRAHRAVAGQGTGGVTARGRETPCVLERRRGNHDPTHANRSRGTTGGRRRALPSILLYAARLRG